MRSQIAQFAVGTPSITVARRGLCRYEFTEAQEQTLRSLKSMIQGTGHLFGVLGVLTIGDAFASVSSREIADLAGQLSDGVDWGFFSLFLWKVRSFRRRLFRVWHFARHREPHRHPTAQRALTAHADCDHRVRTLTPSPPIAGQGGL